MRKKFPAYYRINRDKLIKCFDNFVFAFDASSLLDIFRLNQGSTDEVFNVIKHYGTQIVVPFQAAKEYNCNIHRVLNEQIQYINSAEKTLRSFVQSLSAKRQQPYISQETTTILDQLQHQIEQDFQSQRSYLENQLIHGELMNKMADLLDEKVLDPFSKDDIEDIKKEGEIRYKTSVPPGYKDDKKDDNQYGDLIIWKEILKYAKANNKCILYVTNDAKEDWVIKENGKTIGPRYDLIEEFYGAVGNEKLIFHVYTLDSFLDFIREKNQALVSETTIDNVREIVQQSRQSAVDRIGKSVKGEENKDDELMKATSDHTTLVEICDSLSEPKQNCLENREKKKENEIEETFSKIES